MTTVTENDLKRVEDKIDRLADTIATNQNALESRFTKLEDDIKAVDEKVTDVDKKLAIIDARLDEWKPSINKISDLSEKVGELKNWKQVGVVVITAFISSIFSGTVGALVGWFVRSVK
jgi:archaellum component FlaC